MDILAVTRYLEMNVETFIELKLAFLSLLALHEIKPCSFLSDMDFFAVTCYLEINIQTFF